MIISHTSKERGQSIVILALMMVALLAILALSIDGGLTYAQRRRAQNAADAGALAGARAMCIPGGGDPVSLAREYANRNGISDVATNVLVATSQVNVVRSVVVTVTVPYDTFFAGVIGIANAQVGAVAEAACYPPCTGAGVLPVAWSCKLPDAGGGSIGNLCDVFPNDSDGCQFGDDPIYIVVDSIKIEDDIDCDASGIDCDSNDDGINDVIAISGGNRAWLDLNGKISEGGDDLKDWVEGDGVPSTQVHTWYSGDTGVKTSVFQAIENFRLNRDVLIPVFDDFVAELKNGELPPASKWHDGTDQFRDDGAGDYFHVIAFAGYHVTCVSTGSSDPCPAKQFLLDNNPGIFMDANTKTVEGCFTQGIFEGGGLPGQCNNDTGAYILKLIR